MAIEIEKKYIIDAVRLDQLAERLGELGAEFLSEVFEENYLHRGGILDEMDAVLRLRITGAATTLTYKQKQTVEGGFKHQIEFETEVSDAAATEKIIDALGYRLAIVYEKRRKAWRLGNVEVVLDELPFGFYMEIEGERNDIVAAETLLLTEDLTVEPRGYPSLAAKFGTIVDGVYEARFRRSSAD